MMGEVLRLDLMLILSKHTILYMELKLYMTENGNMTY